MSFSVIDALLLVPLAGALLLTRFRADQIKQVRSTAIFISAVTFVASLYLLVETPATAGFMHFSRVVLVENPEITWCVGVDGVSLYLVLLTTFLTPIVLLASARTVNTHVREYHIAFLLLETAVMGALVSLDLVLFFAFFELLLVPMYLIIGIWGHERRIYAAVKFFIFTAVGSLAMLVAILYGYSQLPEGVASFNLLVWYEHLNLAPEAQFWPFCAFALAFAIKVPLIPVHTWLPDAHVEAPTGGSVLLAGVLLKLGTYGFVRFSLPLFPNAALDFAWLFIGLAVAGIVYGAFMAWVQFDLKKLVAYSSISHLGFVMLGIFAIPIAVAAGTAEQSRMALTGATFGMISHGLTAAALFLIVGVLYARRHTREIGAFGGLARVTPVLAVVTGIAMLGSIGLPSTSGFVGEFLILMGTWQTSATIVTVLGIPITSGLVVIAAGLGVIFGAVYMLSMYRRTFFGPVRDPVNLTVRDLSGLERVYLVPVLALILLLGLFPNAVLGRMDAAAARVIELFTQRLVVVPGV